MLHARSGVSSIVVLGLFAAASLAASLVATGTAPPAARPPTDEERHNDLYKRGSDLIAPYLLLSGRRPKTGSALWVQGKAFQSLNDHAQAYARFKRAYAIQSENPDVGRELMLECLQTQRMNEGVEVARATSSRTPRDAGLRANLGLALLMAGRIEEAADATAAALQLSSSDPITRDLLRVIQEVRAGKRAKPRRLADIQK